jgi:hypothetical protein
LSPARAVASRRNGAKSCGSKTPEGKARSARNALKQGFRAERFVVVGDEDLRAFEALDAALGDELAPDGALQGLLAGADRAPPGGSSAPSGSRPSCSLAMPIVTVTSAWP